VSFKGETKRVLRATREGRKIGICGNWAVDAKKLAVRDRKRNCVGVHLLRRRGSRVTDFNTIIFAIFSNFLLQCLEFNKSSEQELKITSKEMKLL